MKLIGLYKTNEAAQKAKSMMLERGIPSTRTSLLAPDDTDGPHLATYADHTASATAWLGALGGGLIGMALAALLFQGELRWSDQQMFVAGRLVAATWGFTPGAVLGALVGYIQGTRVTTLRADFFEADEKRGATALGVVAESPEEAETARYSFRSTGALQVRTSDSTFSLTATGDAGPSEPS